MEKLLIFTHPVFWVLFFVVALSLFFVRTESEKETLVLGFAGEIVCLLGLVVVSTAKQWFTLSLPHVAYITAVLIACGIACIRALRSLIYIGMTVPA